MKIIFSSPIPGEITQLKSILENAGIACFTRNEISAGLSPEIPLSESTPELWIQNDGDLAKALQIKSVWKASTPARGSNWVCSQCGEASEAQFDSCWKCGAARKADDKTIIPPDIAPEQSEQKAAENKEPVEEAVVGGIPCVRCDRLIKIGVKYCPYCGYTQPYETAV